MTEDQGASANELMLALCRSDQEDELIQLLSEGHCDVTFTDGAGNTAAHYAAKNGSIGCLEALVNHDDIDLDMKNRIEGDTPLHLAVQYANEDHEMATAMVELLLAGGADPSIENRNKLTPAMMVNPKFQDIKSALEQANISYDIDDADIANDEAVNEDDLGSGSETED
ncbi:ankyrin [Mycotypha africana]|uniref:ankyrin n=1 Tax=Mycotypha africana TaxID=64632 RepID=UPI0023018C94|nr:ankyrin [Mycotypha africana]KAI8975079.1 ankyrin [Mycotypha africana]